MKAPAWRDDEIVFLREHYGTTSADDIAGHLGRTVAAVIMQASRLGNTKHVTPQYPELVQEWILDLEADGESERTRTAYQSDMLAFSTWFGRDLVTAQPDDLRRYVRYLVERRQAPGGRGRRITVLRMFFGWLKRRNRLPASVAEDIRPPKRPQHIHRWFTSEQIQSLRAVLSDTTHRTVRDRAIIELGLLGLRVSEVAGLTVERVLNITNPDDAGLFVLRKGSKEQYLPLARDTRDALVAWLEIRPRVPSSYVFFRLPFQPTRPRLHYASLEKMLARYCREADIPLPVRGSFHLLRHSAGQRMADLGFGIEEAQAFLGHESAATTAVYYQVSNARLKQAMKRFSY